MYFHDVVQKKNLYFHEGADFQNAQCIIKNTCFKLLMVVVCWALTSLDLSDLRKWIVSLADQDKYFR